MQAVVDAYSREEETPKRKKLLTCIIDFCIGRDGKPIIFEFQEFAQSSNPSELSKLSQRKVEKNTAKILQKLGIEDDYDQYDLEAIRLDKVIQRKSLAENGCQDLQPKFMSLSAEDIDKEESYEKIRKFLAENPGIEKFAIKADRYTRGEGNNFLTREELLTRIEGKTLGQLEIKHLTILSTYKSLPIAESGCQFVLEEFINPSLQSSQGSTLRACIAFDPKKPDELNAILMCAYLHNSSSSHDYKVDGSRVDFVDDRQYFFRDGKINSIKELRDPRIDEAIDYETKRHFLRAAQAIFTNIDKELSPTKRIELGTKKYHNPYVYPATLESLMRFQLLSEEEPHGELYKQIELIKSTYRHNVRNDKIVEDTKNILKEILPLCLKKPEIFDHQDFYPLKKLLASMATEPPIGDSASEKSNYKRKFDDFMLMPTTRETLVGIMAMGHDSIFSNITHEDYSGNFLGGADNHLKALSHNKLSNKDLFLKYLPK